MKDLEKRTKFYEEQIDRYEKKMGVSFDSLRKYNISKIHYLLETRAMDPIEAIQLLAEEYKDLKYAAAYIKGLELTEGSHDKKDYINLAEKFFGLTKKTSKKRKT